MRILFVVGQDRETKLFREQIQPLIEQLLAYHHSYTSNRYGLLFTGNKNLVQIENSGLILFQINSVESSDTQVPQLTPGTVKDINGFISEFNPDLIHSFDEGFIGLITQYTAVSKKIPYVLSLLSENSAQKVGFASKVILGISSRIGITDEFVGKFYNNATAVIGSHEQTEAIENEYDYAGYIVHNKDLNLASDYINFYKRMIVRFKQYEKSIRFKSLLGLVPNKGLRNKILNKLPERKVAKNTKKVVPSSVLLTGAAIIGSLLAFTAIKGISKIKPQKDKHNS